MAGVETALNNIIKNLRKLHWWRNMMIDSRIWDFSKEKVHSEKFRSETKDKVEDFVSDEERRFVNGRWHLATLLLFFRQ